jgi:hypothetical protein
MEPEDEPLTEEDRRAVAASREYFRRNPEGGFSNGKYLVYDFQHFINLMTPIANPSQPK